MSEQLCNINKVAELTGLTPSLLRIWELRYGWPKPHRHINGYRKYDVETIDDLLWVVERLAQGCTIRELIVDGTVIRERHREIKPGCSRVVFDFGSIQQPASEEGRRLRSLMEQAICTENIGQQVYVQSLAIRLRPNERELAVNALLRVAKIPG